VNSGELKPRAIYGAPLLNEVPLKAPRGSFDIHYGRVGGQRRERYPAMRVIFLKYRRRNDGPRLFNRTLTDHFGGGGATGNATRIHPGRFMAAALQCRTSVPAACFVAPFTNSEKRWR